MDYKEEIKQFLIDLYDRYNFNYIFSLQRKGMAHLKMVSTIRKRIGEKVFFLDAARLIGPNILKDKNILIYDDACKTGTSLKEALNIFKDYEGTIRTAAFVTRKNCAYNPDYTQYILRNDLFNKLLSGISDLNFGDHIYDDHLVYKLKAIPGNYSELKQILGELGKFEEATEFKVNGYKILILENFNFINLPDFYTHFGRREGVEKIRIFINDNGLINIIPRIYPAIDLKKLWDYCHKNKLINLCEQFSIDTSKKNDKLIYLCTKCVIWTINAQLIKKFRPYLIDALNRSNYKILNEDINKKDLEAAVFDGEKAISEIVKMIGIGQ